MNHFRFESPHWSATFWIALPVFVVLAWFLYRRSTVLTRLVSTLMQKRLIRQPSPLRRIVVLALYAIATICFVFALMRPQYGLRYVSSPKIGAQLMFCLDVSKSMLAEDAAPNRLDRAKADITELLSYLDGDQVGLIAFAGRASVLCPMTTDYGFFRLILDGASPNSVGRGGTSLEEPLRKAIEGYREGGDVSRMVVLITDGEDHDSRPMDAAEEARERGIRIIAVGLGDETGSEIRLTDSQTGGTKTLLDQDGNPVISRLDGETLRELALATDGVYIPAGTGRLDLKSIYEAHLQPLVRDELENERRAVRQEAFQWAILAGLILTAIAIYLGSRPATVRGEDASGESASKLTVHAATLLLMLALASPSIAIAETPNPKTLNTDAVATAEASSESESSKTPSPKTSLADTETLDVRDQYNRGLKLLGSSSIQRLDDAEQYFISARDQADTDGELRFRSTYNLGWVSVQRADLLINSPSQQANESLTQALTQLQQAADWFRDAVRLRPESDDARHNLEIVLKRIIQLRDQINRNEAGDVMQQLQALIESQRTRLQSLRGLVQQINRSDDPNIVDEYRAQFNRAAVDHRVALSDLEGLVEAVADEIDAIAAKDESEKTPEDAVRELQLQAAAEHLATAGQRLGATRSQLRRRQSMRAFRRASASLDELKRAREQLLDPLKMLDGLLADATPHLRETILIASEDPTTFTPSEKTATPDPVPAWIDQESLQETQANLSTRTNELSNRLTAGLEAADNQEQTDPSEDPQAAQRQAKLLRQIRLALPSLEIALDHMRRSETELATPNYIQSIEHQVASIKSLRHAREQFADLRALIELAANGQQQIAEVSSAWNESIDGADAAPQDPPQLDPAVTKDLIARQQSNIRRAERIAGLIAEQLQQLDTASETDPSSEQGTEQNSDHEKERYRLASQLASNAIEQMKATNQSLAEAAKTSVDEASAKDVPDESKDEAERPKAEDTESENTETEPKDAVPSNRQVNHAAEAAQDAEDAHQSLQQLRRLFFSLIEHLQETARRQSELNDQTQLAVGLRSQADADDGSSEKARFAELAQEQAELAEVATQLATAFEEQSQQSPPPEAPEQQQRAMQESAQKSLRASELIGEGSEFMNQAKGDLANETEARPDPTDVQTKALQKLLEALQELQPPPDQAQQEQSQQQNQSQQDQQQDQDQQQQEQQQQQAQPQLDPSRILQAVRDREAQRRREREMNLGTRQAPVTKDW
ncbi:VWA domain-containing protein [Roseiconus lacunae]|uniref:VWA domain-containing protein n=1 Tax=Roseiconus lacunae TaxID=2605694 RepID=UPI0011F1A1DE|nr:VWA domain-containing protein [Roseiconus lacunae]